MKGKGLCLSPPLFLPLASLSQLGPASPPWAASTPRAAARGAGEGCGLTSCLAECKLTPFLLGTLQLHSSSLLLPLPSRIVTVQGGCSPGSFMGPSALWGPLDRTWDDPLHSPCHANIEKWTGASTAAHSWLSFQSSWQALLAQLGVHPQAAMPPQEGPCLKLSEESLPWKVKEGVPRTLSPSRTPSPSPLPCTLVVYSGDGAGY